jgi:FKBP-type peptidyl-prolyl cis-trans isomerase
MTTALAVVVNNNRVIALFALRQYWERLYSRLKPSRHGGRHAIAQDELEREISVINEENHVLAEEVRRVRSDFEHARDEENKKIVDLKQVRQTMQLAREADQRKISELEDRLARLEDERKQARDRVQALENTLTDATTRLEQTDQQINGLQRNAVEQAKQFQDSINDANIRLVETANKVKVLGTQLDNERRRVHKIFGTLQDRLRAQDVRLNWMIAVASFAVLLGATAGAVLIWDVQKNSTLLTGMSRDIKELMTSVNEKTGLQPSSEQEQRQLARSAASPDDRAAVTGNPASSSAVTMRPVSPATATNTAAPSPNLPDSVPEPAHIVSRLGIQQATREDAKRFFENNATSEGMISLPSGVQYRVVKSGSGRTPSLSDRVVVSYVGMEPGGKVFDETYSTGAPETFSMNELTPGWREVLLKMQEGAEFELYVPPSLAASGSVRKRSMLGFEPNIYLIELLKVEDTSESSTSGPAK